MKWLWQKQRVVEPDWLVIVQSYGSILEKPIGIGNSRNEADLPFSKGVIKAALIAASKQPGISREQLNALSICYVELASFVPRGGQPGPFQNLPENPESMSEAEMMEFAKAVVDSGNADAVIGTSIIAEQEALLAEWQNLSGEAGNSNA